MRSGRQRTRWQRRVDELAAVRERGEIGDDGWFAGWPRCSKAHTLPATTPGTVGAPDGRLIVCGYGSPRSRVPADPVGEILRELDFEPELELAAEAPEGGGAIVELAALRAG